MIEVHDLTKRYGDRVAVAGVSFSVERGQVLGFLGPNGAGKTTTMRMLTGFLPPSSGTARVAGFDVFTQSAEVRRRIGYLPENPPLYNDMTVVPYLRFVAKLKGLSRGDTEAAIDRVLATCALGAVGARLLGHLSKGYRQRVGLAQAMIHDPEVLILDEPTIGLDPTQREEILNVIKGIGKTRTIVLSTHILPDVLEVCAKVVIINEGRVVVEDLLANLTRDGRDLRAVFTAAIAAGHHHAAAGADA